MTQTTVNRPPGFGRLVGAVIHPGRRGADRVELVMRVEGPSPRGYLRRHARPGTLGAGVRPPVGAPWLPLPTPVMQAQPESPESPAVHVFAPSTLAMWRSDIGACRHRAAWLRGEADAAATRAAEHVAVLTAEAELLEARAADYRAVLDLIADSAVAR